jgi:1-acyl-sn-glycerol-3-phosphate acyltransferase
VIIRFLLRHTLPRRLVGLVVLGFCVLCALVLLPLARLAGRRAARFAAFGRCYVAVEVTGLLRLIRLRRAAPEAHYELLHRLLGRLYHSARRDFGLRIAPPSPAAPLPPGPMILAARHAGPGDSFLLVYGLLAVARRYPRVVLSGLLTLDPFIDVLLRRTPNCFVGLEPDERLLTPERIAAIAGTLGPRETLVIFPEGRKFTTARRTRLIARLRARRNTLLPTARKLEHVLPPHSSGLFAAIDAAPSGTQVAFLAHTGLDWIESAHDAWAAVPLTTQVTTTWWTVPVEAVPADPAEREEWLRAQWLRMDGWIEEHAPVLEDADAGPLNADRHRVITAGGD